MEDGGWKMEDGGWKIVEDGGSKMEDDSAEKPSVHPSRASGRTEERLK